MRSEKQREASRRNGALSRGPVTPEGRANSARGALVHGLYARDVVLSGENREHYKAILDAFVQDWQPTTDTQLLLVADAASCYWRLLRAESHETVLTEVRSEAERDETERIVPGGGPRARFAFGFQRISDQSSVLSQINRLSTRLSRQMERSIRLLREMKKDRNRTESGNNQILPAGIDPDNCLETQGLPSQVDPPNPGTQELSTGEEDSVCLVG